MVIRCYYITSVEKGTWKKIYFYKKVEIKIFFQYNILLQTLVSTKFLAKWLNGDEDYFSNNPISSKIIDTET